MGFLSCPPEESSPMKRRLGLGTAQFGCAYGIANKTGQISRGEMAQILAYARSHGLDVLDTAMAYGKSEQGLGEIGVSQWKVVTKLPAVPRTVSDIRTYVHEAVARSLVSLRIPELYGLLLHRPLQLLESDGEVLYRAVVAVRDKGQVSKIGVSLYAPEELDAIWPRYKFDLVQIPFNLINRLFATSGWIARLKEHDVEVHARSVFLQGLLLMEAEERPPIFGTWDSLWEQWHRWLADQRLSAREACLGFVLSYPEIDRVIIGVDNLRQLKENLDSAAPLTILPPSFLQSRDPNLIDPSRWPQ